MSLEIVIIGTDDRGYRWTLREVPSGQTIANSTSSDDGMAYSSAVECARGAERNLARIMAERSARDAGPALLAALQGLVEAVTLPRATMAENKKAFDDATAAALAALALVDQPGYRIAPSPQQPGTAETIERHARMAGAFHGLVDAVRKYGNEMDSGDDPKSPTGDDYNTVVAMIEGAADSAGLA